MSVMSGVRKYVGDKAFYRMLLSIAIPIMLQNGITNAVNLLDNLMVGRLGTEAMAGVSIISQFVFVFNLLIFGAVSAAGIFTAQYQGCGNEEGVRQTFRFKLLVNAAAVVIGLCIFLMFGDDLIRLFLHEGDSTGDLALTFSYAKEYLFVMLIGLAPFAVTQVYASTMRETGETVFPLIAGVAAIITNCALNAVCIFALGWGVSGAAVATVISRFLEAFMLVIWGHRHKEKCPYLTGVYSSMHIESSLVKRITLGGLPLMANEFLWSVAITMRTQCYSTRGLDVVAALNISTTVYNVFSVVYISMGSTIAIIIGTMLGAGRDREAKDTDRKLMAFTVFCGVCSGALIAAVSGVFPLLYETGDTARSLASYMMIVLGILLPFDAYSNGAYFTLRSGGRIFITMLFDSVFMWAVIVPICWAVANFTDVSIFALFAIGQGCDCLKTLISFIFLHTVKWENTLVGAED